MYVTGNEVVMNPRKPHTCIYCGKTDKEPYVSWNTFDGGEFIGRSIAHLSCYHLLDAKCHKCHIGQTDGCECPRDCFRELIDEIASSIRAGCVGRY